MGRRTERDAPVALLAAVAGVVALTLGCAAAPLRERDDTLALIEQARQAGAETYAVEELERAKAAFIEAQGKIDAEEYGEGLEAFHRAAWAAEEAKAQAIARRPAVERTPEPKPSSAPAPAGPAGPNLRVPGLEPPQVLEPAAPSAPAPVDAPATTPGPAAAGTPPAASSAPQTVPLLDAGEPVGVAAASAAEKRTQAPVEATAGGPAPTRVHLVKKGETLSSIAKKELGSEAAWREIYEMNRDVLKSPKSAQAGMKLQIPER